MSQREIELLAIVVIWAMATIAVVRFEILQNRINILETRIATAEKLLMDLMERLVVDSHDKPEETKDAE